MKRAFAAIVLFWLCVATPAAAVEGLVALKSPHPAKETMNRVEDLAKQRGLNVFARIDLPLKALVWEDAQGQVWLGYNDLSWLSRRHGAAQCPAADALGKALSGLAEAAVAR